MKRSLNIQINFSDKTLYAFVFIMIFLIASVGVYAYGGSSPNVVGHSAGEIEVEWNSITGIPADIADGDSGGLWTQSGNDAYYNSGNVVIANDITANNLNADTITIGGASFESAYSNMGEDSYGAWILGWREETCGGGIYSDYACPVNAERTCLDVNHNGDGYTIYRTVRCVANYALVAV